jgi:hypothetical protein
MAFDPNQNINALSDTGQTLTLITPSDSTDLTTVFKYLVIGATGGNISVDDEGGGVTAAIFPVSAGTAFDLVRVKRVRSTGTTATPIYGVL